MYRSHVLVCGGTGCTSSGCQEIMKTLQAELEKNGLTEEVAIVQTGCHGLCALGPITRSGWARPCSLQLLQLPDTCRQQPAVLHRRSPGYAMPRC